MADYPKIAVAIAVLNEERYIESCISSILVQDYPGMVEILVTDGGSSDRTGEIVKKLQSENRNIFLIDNPGKIQAAGRNLAWNRTDAPFITYLDAKRTADKSWLSVLYKAYSEIESTGINIGAVGSVHFRKEDTPFQRASDIAFRSILSGAGESHFLNAGQPMETHHAVMCLYKRETLDECGYYDERFPIGEDIELNNRLTFNYGKKIFVVPSAINFYEYRNSFTSLFRQQYLYGVWRFAVMRKLGNYFPVPFAAALALIFMLILFITGLFFKPLLLIFILNVMAYFSMIFGFSLQVSLKNKVSPFTLTSVLASIHAGYGLGAVMGILKFIVWKNKFA